MSAGGHGDYLCSENKKNYIETEMTLIKNIKKKSILKTKDNTNKIKPGPVCAANGTFAGEVNLQWDAVKNADNYLIEISRNGTDWYRIDIVADPQYSLKGLTGGRTYYFRVSVTLHGIRSSWSRAVIKKIK